MSNVRTRKRIQLFLAGEVVIFAVAALVHSGVLLNGYEHAKAATAESVIAAVLAIGLVSSWARPPSTRTAGLTVQAFALAGTFVGLFTIAVGVGPRTGPDILLHGGLVVLLTTGLIVAARAPKESHQAEP